MISYTNMQLKITLEKSMKNTSNLFYDLILLLEKNKGGQITNKYTMRFSY